MTAWLTPETALLLLILGFLLLVFGMAAGEENTSASGAVVMLAGYLTGVASLRDDDDQG